jgi:hypothetical protein
MVRIRPPLDSGEALTGPETNRFKDEAQRRMAGGPISGKGSVASKARNGPRVLRKGLFFERSDLIACPNSE